MKKLTNVQDAIGQAIKRGYRNESSGEDYPDFNLGDKDGKSAVWANEVNVLTDPLFWQALGKARGYIDRKWPDGEMRCSAPKCDARYCAYAGFRNPYEFAHAWFENRMVGGDEKIFWESLP